MNSGQAFAGTRNNYILLDLSTKDTVKLYNSNDSMQAPLDDLENTRLHSKGTLEVDISALTGNEFTPCISADKPNIKAIVTELSPDLSFGLRVGVNAQEANPNIHDFVRDNCIQGELNTIVSNHPQSEFAQASLKIKLSDSDSMNKVVGNIILGEDSDQIKQQKLQALQGIHPELTGEAVDKAVGNIVNSLSENAIKIQKLQALQNIYPQTPEGVAKTVENILDTNASNRTRQEKLQIICEIHPVLDSYIKQAIPAEKPITTEDKHIAVASTYYTLEENPEKRKEFAVSQFNKFSETCTGILNDEEKNRVKKVLIGIIKPLCRSDAEADALEANAGKMVRECASEAGVTKSWSQAWNKFKDGVRNVVNYLTGRENKAAIIMSRHPELIDAITNSMIKNANKNANAIQSKQDVRAR